MPWCSLAGDVVCPRSFSLSATDDVASVLSIVPLVHVRVHTVPLPLQPRLDVIAAVFRAVGCVRVSVLEAFAAVSRPPCASDGRTITAACMGKGEFDLVVSVPLSCLELMPFALRSLNLIAQEAMTKADWDLPVVCVQSLSEFVRAAQLLVM